MRGRGKTAALCLMALLMAATFLSRTIMYHLTAKCTMVKAYSGRLSATIPFLEAAIPPEYVNSVALPMLGEEATIRLNRSRNCTLVQKGDILMELSPPACEKRLQALTKDWTAAREKAALFRVNYPIALAAAQADKETAQKALARSNRRTRPAAERQLAKAEQALKLIKDEGIVEGMTQSSHDQEEKTLKQAIDALHMLQRAGWRIKAPEDALLLDVTEHIGKDGYLFSYVPLNNPLPLQVQTDAAFAPYLKAGQTLTFRTQEGKAIGESCTISALENYKGGLTLMLEAFLPENFPALKDARLQTALTDYDVLVPPGALVKENTVYVAQRGDSWWGKIWVVKERKVRVGLGSDTATPILSGLSEGEMVITSWDRAISPGERVVLPL